MKSIPIALGVLLMAGAASAQQYTISTIAGIGTTQGYYGDTGAATAGELSFPTRVAVDANGDVFIVDYYNFAIREVSGGIINTVAGDGTGQYGGDDGPATLGTMGYVYGIAVNGPGTSVYFTDTGYGRVRLFTVGGNINTIAGNGLFGYTGDGGPATSAALGFPAGLALDSAGNLYIADYGTATVRKVNTKGIISTVAGTGVWGYSGDGGPATQATFEQPYGIAVDPAGNIFISDIGNATIREITTDGNIHTMVTGVTTQNFTVDSADNIYYPNYNTNTVQKIQPNLTQFTIAGIAGSPGFSGDGGLATAAQLNQPQGVALDTSGNVYVADTVNQVIRELMPAQGTTTTSNAASGNASAVAPGEIVAVYGAGLGPTTLVSAAPTNGSYLTQLAGTTVSIGGVNAPMIYTSATQVAAVVPFGTPVGGTVNVIVTYQGQQAVESQVNVVAAVPGLFTANSTGTGPLAAVNQNGTINSATSPAPEGSVVSLYLTGAGQMSPASVDGALAAAPLATPVQGVGVTLSGQPAVVTYAGAAPGEINGLLQINVQIPANLIPIVVTNPVQVPVSVVIGGYSVSQPNVTISVSEQ